MPTAISDMDLCGAARPLSHVKRCATVQPDVSEARRWQIC